MFTGLVSDVGTVLERRDAGEIVRFRLASGFPAAEISLGASIACDGCCLTATEIAAEGEGSVFAADVSPETLARTTLGDWVPGRRVNLERSLRIGDEIGGHFVSGHVDAAVRILERRDDGETSRFVFELPAELARFVAVKGSITLAGTSLTVNEVATDNFGVTLVPHTLAVTTWGERAPGDRVNLEIDMLARYVARLRETEAT